MPNGNTYTTQEFATLIRDKYNAYSDISDEELVAKILEKYPIYRDQISDEKTSARKSKYLDFGEEEVIVEDEVVDGEVVEEDVEVIEEEKQVLPKIDRVEKVKEELTELESSFGYDPKWAPETWVEEEKLDEYYKDEPRYHSWKKRKELIDASVLTAEEIEELKTKREDLDSWSPQLPSQLLDPTKVYSDAELESIAVENADYSTPDHEGGGVYNFKKQLIYQQSLNGGNGKEAQIRTQKVEKENIARGINEKMRVTNLLPSGSTGEEIYKNTLIGPGGVNPYLTNPKPGDRGSSGFADGMIEEYDNGVQLWNGNVPLGEGDRSALGYVWDGVVHGVGQVGLGGRAYHYKLPDGSAVPFEYFNNAETQDYTTKLKSDESELQNLIKFDGNKTKQVEFVEGEVESFLTENELLHRDKEAELVKLKADLKNKSGDEWRDAKFIIGKLEREIELERNELGLAKRIVDEDGNILNSIAAFKSSEVEAAAEEKAAITGLDQLKQNLVSDYFEYMELLKEVGKNTVDIGKSRNIIEKTVGYLAKDPDNIFQHPAWPLRSDTFYDDVDEIQKMIETGKLGTVIDLPGNHPLATKFEAIQNRMLINNRAIQLNTDATTLPKLSKLERWAGNFLEGFTGENSIAKSYNKGLSVGTTTEDERYEIMKGVKQELGYELPQEILDAHETTITDVGGDFVVDLAPLIFSTMVLKKSIGYTSPKGLEKVGDWLKGSGKSKAWNGIVNMTIASSAHKSGALGEMVYFYGIDKTTQGLFGSEPASQALIGSLGAGNASASMVSSFFSKKYEKALAPLLNFYAKSNVVKGIGGVVGPAASGTAIFQTAKGVEHFSTHGVDGIEEIFTTKQIVGEFMGFVALGSSGKLKPGIEGLANDILALQGHSVQSFKAGKVLGLKKGKDGYFPTPEEVNAKVKEKTDELIDNAGKKGELNVNKQEQLQKEIYEIEQAGEALNLHNDIVKAKKTASYVQGLDASAYVVSQKLLRGEELNAKDQAVLNQLGPEYIAYKANGNKPPGVEMKGAIDKVYAANQQIFEVLTNTGVNPHSKEGIELITAMSESFNISSKIEKLENEIKRKHWSHNLAENLELKNAKQKLKENREYQESLYKKAQEKSDKTYEQDYKDTEILIDQINKKGGFFGEQLKMKEVNDAQWRELGLDLEAEGQFVPTDNTIYIHKDRALARKANSVASHELLHALLKKSFKNKAGDITVEGMEIIDSFRDLLSPEQQKLINDRIIEQYSGTKNGEVEVPKQKYYEEYLNAFIDGIKQGKIQYSDKTWDKLAEQVGPNFRNLFGKGKVDVTSGKELFNFLRDFNKAETSPRARARIIEFATKDNVVGEKGKEVDVEVEGKEKEVTVEGKEKEVREEVEVGVESEGKETEVEVKVEEEITKEDKDIKDDDYSVGPIPLRTRPKANEESEVMTGEKAKNEEALLEKMILHGIENNHTADAIFNRIAKRMGWYVPENLSVKRYIKNRVKDLLLHHLENGEKVNLKLLLNKNL